MLGTRVPLLTPSHFPRARDCGREPLVAQNIRGLFGLTGICEEKRGDTDLLQLKVGVVTRNILMESAHCVITTHNANKGAVKLQNNSCQVELDTGLRSTINFDNLAEAPGEGGALTTRELSRIPRHVDGAKITLTIDLAGCISKHPKKSESFRL